jgi:hypothetical protein
VRKAAGGENCLGLEKFFNELDLDAGSSYVDFGGFAGLLALPFFILHLYQPNANC